MVVASDSGNDFVRGTRRTQMLGQRNCRADSVKVQAINCDPLETYDSPEITLKVFRRLLAGASLADSESARRVVLDDGQTCRDLLVNAAQLPWPWLVLSLETAPSRLVSRMHRHTNDIFGEAGFGSGGRVDDETWNRERLGTFLCLARR